jgi:class 3 adenylate cyclase
MGYIAGGNYKQQCFHMESGTKYAMNHSEYLFGTYCITQQNAASIFNGENFINLIPKIKKRKSWLMEIKNVFLAEFSEVVIQFILEITGVSKWNPQFIIPNVETMKCADNYFPTIQGILEFHKGNFNEALALFEKAEPCVNNQIGLFDYYENKFYHALTLIKVIKTSREEKHITRLQQHLEDWKVYGLLGPEYLNHRYNLINSFWRSTFEINKMEILQEFEEIYESSKKDGLLVVSAISAEIILEYCEEHKFPKGFSKMYFTNAYQLWQGMGAKMKFEQLKKKYYKYVTTNTHKHSTSANTTTKSGAQNSSTGMEGDSLDIMSIIKASQALSGELSTSNLILKVMDIIIENTGAQIGMLFFEGSKNGDYLEAVIKSGNVTQIHKPVKEMKENDTFCTTLYNLSKSLKKTIIINDISKSEHSSNKYLEKEQVKSICIHPILKGKKYVGSIYLEHKSLEGIFDENRIEILEHISSQIAISFENAKLYDDVQSLNLSYGRFLPKEFLEQLGKGDVRNIKKGDASSKKLCVLFSDIRSFTDITEKLNPSESFSFVNQILQYLAPIISKHNGFIDKFFGDSIMALFPVDVDDSIKCGYEMLSTLNVYNKECRKGLAPVQIGIGIHYGDCMIGTIGAEDRIDATVISDTVNTASRVESLTKTLGARFVVTEDVIQNSKLSSKNRYIGKYLLKGKKNPISLFQMLINDTSIDVEKFTGGVQYFEARKFEEAERIFSNLTDKTSKYLENVAKKYSFYAFSNSWSGEIEIDKDGNLIELENSMVDDSSIDQLTEEEKRKIWEKLQNEDLSLILKSLSKQNPKKVRSLIGEFKK